MTVGFDGRHVVVTGGTGALGTAVVTQLLAAGAVCHVPVFDAVEKARAPFAGDSNARFADGVDLTDEAQVSTFYGGVDVPWASVHIAGGFAMGPIHQTDKTDFMGQINLNLVTAFLCCREAVKKMQAGGEGGRIVNVAARPALEPRTGAGMTAYTASKAAVGALTQALAEEVAGDGIWVNAVVPSILDTPANRTAMPKAQHDLWPKPAEVAESIVFLASPANQALRGALAPVYGRS